MHLKANLFQEAMVFIRVSEYKSMDISKKIYYSASFLALKMAAIVHTGKKWAEPSVRLVESTCTFRQGA